MALILSQSRESSACRFLELPPELRLAIYLHLLGGFVIHFDRPGTHLESEMPEEASLCKYPTFDEESFELLGWNPKSQPGHFTLFDGHKRWNAPPAEAIQLNLLLVCRQVYQEANTLPFQQNRFTFSKPLSVLGLHVRFTEAQWKAITTVTIHQTRFENEWQSSSSSDVNYVISPLPGVTNLRIFVELCPDNLISDGGISVMSDDAQDRLIDRMRMFRSPKLKHIEVLINNTKPEYMRTLSARNIEAWTERLKEMLLGNKAKAGDKGQSEKRRRRVRQYDEEEEDLS